MVHYKPASVAYYIYLPYKFCGGVDQIETVRTPITLTLEVINVEDKSSYHVSCTSLVHMTIVRHLHRVRECVFIATQNVYAENG